MHLLIKRKEEIVMISFLEERKLAEKLSC